MKLLYRGDKNTDELIFDYINRIGRKNGFNDEKKFKKLVSNYFNSDLELKVNDLHHKAIYRLAMESNFRRSIALDESHRYRQSKYSFWSRKPGKCENCFHEDPYIRFYWWLTSYRKCHVHGSSIFSKNEIENQSGLPLLPDSLCELIVTRYENSDSMQCLVLNEIERFYKDQSIVGAIIFHFPMLEKLEVIKDSLTKAVLNVNLIGFPASERIKNIAKVISSYIGEEMFWLRAIVLMLCSYRKDTLVIKGGWFLVDSEYSRYGQYIIGTDTKFSEILSKVERFRLRKEMDNVSVVGILEGCPSITDKLISKIKLSFFSLRELNSWVSVCQKSEDLFKKKSLREVYMGNYSRLV